MFVDIKLLHDKRQGPDDCCLCIDTCTIVHVCNLCMYICMYVCMYVCMCVCVCVCIYVCMHICMYIMSTGYVQLDAHMLNSSKHEGATVRIRCEITGYPLPRYRWLRGRTVLADGSRGAGDGQADGGTKESNKRVDAKTTPWGSR